MSLPIPKGCRLGDDPVSRASTAPRARYSWAMPAPPQDELSGRALREALLARPAAPAPARRRGKAAPPPHDPAVAAMLPSPDEVLAASPNIARLCDSYDRLHRSLVARGRRQKLGVASLVGGVGIGTLVLSRIGSVPVATLDNLVLAVAAVSCAALALLAMLWMRDENRLKTTQGDRLMRALQLNCSLDEDRVVAFRRYTQPTTAFYDCYRVWRVQHPSHDGPILNAIASFLAITHRRAAA